MFLGDGRGIAFDLGNAAMCDVTAGRLRSRTLAQVSDWARLRRHDVTRRPEGARAVVRLQRLLCTRGALDCPQTAGSGHRQGAQRLLCSTEEDETDAVSARLCLALMRKTKRARWILAPIAFGLVVAVFYGAPNILFEPGGIWHKLRMVLPLFLFGAWAALVILSEDWRYGRAFHAVTLAAMGLLASEILASPSSIQVAGVVLLCTAAGFFGRTWLKYL